MSIQCLSGFYNPLPGATNETACTRCPVRTTTLTSAAVSREECICQRGFIRQDGDCVPCRVGMGCDTPGTTAHSMDVRRGYWRAPNSTDVRRCPDSSVGCAVSDAAAVCNASQSSCIGGIGEALCAPGLTGTYCRLCVQQSVNGTLMYYKGATSSATAECAECERDDIVGKFVGVYIAIVMGVLAVVVALIVLYERAEPHQQLKVKWLWRASTPHNKLKVQAQRTAQRTGLHP